MNESTGDLDGIRNPAKYVSRLGLAFSQTKPAVDEPRIIRREPDVTGGQDSHGNPYCFSDGIGKISRSCMRKLQVS